MTTVLQTDTAAIEESKTPAVKQEINTTPDLQEPDEEEQPELAGEFFDKFDAAFGSDNDVKPQPAANTNDQ